MEMTDKIKEVLESKERLTLGQVIDFMKIGEIALRVSDSLDNLPSGYVHSVGLKFEEATLNLVTLSGRMPVFSKGEMTEGYVETYVIFSKEEADQLDILK